MSTGAARRLTAGLVARLATTVARGLLEDTPPGGSARWTRTNHRGEPVSLLAGPAVAAGLLAGAVVGAPSVRDALGATVATSSGLAFGLVDDLAEDRGAASGPTKGLRGHLGALAHGELTTGGLKVLGIGAGALVAAALVTPASSTSPATSPGRSRAGAAAVRAFDVATSGALIAAGANLVNLLDLRPGRAHKAAVAVAGPLAVLGGTGSPAAAAVLGATSSALPDDLAERDMLGDSGANALGALLGTAVVQQAPRGVRLAVLGGVVGLTVLSERVSFTRVIERTPVLRDIDAWGRRPAAPAGDDGAPT